MKKYGNGQLIADNTVAVDFWQPHITCSSVRLHFLTHLHADHIVGLTRTWSRPIYTSELNCRLAPKFIPGIKPSLLRPLRLNEETEIRLVGSLHVLVTLIDANHVPGAVMILIKGYFGNVLYTGDFRHDPQMLLIEPLKIVLAREDLDELYLDNTFLYPTCDFPPRSQVARRIINIIRQHEEFVIFIGLRKLGKEKLLIEIAQELRERICVSKSKQEILDLMCLSDVFTTDPNAARIHCVTMTSLRRKFMEEESRKQPTLGIMPTALFYGWDCGTTRPYSASESYNLHVLEYSDHSSYSELLSFVQAVKPKAVKPIVTNPQGSGIMKEWTELHSKRLDMSVFQPFLSRMPQKFFARPDELLSFSEEDMPPMRKRPKVNPERRYRGPKGAIYDTAETSSVLETSLPSTSSLLCISLELLKDKIDEHTIEKRTLQELNAYLDQINEIL